MVARRKRVRWIARRMVYGEGCRQLRAEISAELIELNELRESIAQCAASRACSQRVALCRCCGGV